MPDTIDPATDPLGAAMSMPVIPDAATDPLGAAMHLPAGKLIPSENPNATGLSPEHHLAQRLNQQRTWDEVSPELKAAGVDPERYRQQYQLSEAQAVQKQQLLSTSEAYRQHVPFGFIGDASGVKAYGEAKRRYDEGKGTEKDTHTIAEYERIQQQIAKVKESFAGKVVTGVGGLSQLGAEMGVGGAALGQVARVPGAIGRGASALGFGAEAAIPATRAGQIGQFLGNRAALTATAPSFFVDQARQTNFAAGREADDIRGYPTAVTMAYANNLVLGSFQKMKFVEGIPGGFAARTLAKGSLGAGEAAVVEAGGGVADEFLKDAYKTNTKYGPLGKMFGIRQDRNIGGAFNDLAATAVTFSLFSGLHGAIDKPDLNKAKAKEALDKAVETINSAKTPEEAAQKLKDIVAETKPPIPETTGEPAHPLDTLSKDDLRSLAAGLGVTQAKLREKLADPKQAQMVVDAVLGLQKPPETPPEATGEAPQPPEPPKTPPEAPGSAPAATVPAQGGDRRGTGRQGGQDRRTATDTDPRVIEAKRAERIARETALNPNSPPRSREAWLDAHLNVRAAEAEAANPPPQSPAQPEIAPPERIQEAAKPPLTRAERIAAMGKPTEAAPEHSPATQPGPLHEAIRAAGLEARADKPFSDVHATIGEGSNQIILRHRPEENSVQLDFGDTDKTGETIKKGLPTAATVTLGRNILKIAEKLREKGLAIDYKVAVGKKGKELEGLSPEEVKKEEAKTEAGRKRHEIFSKVLKRAGFTVEPNLGTSGEYIWRPTPSPAPVQPPGPIPVPGGRLGVYPPRGPRVAPPNPTDRFSAIIHAANEGMGKLALKPTEIEAVRLALAGKSLREAASEAGVSHEAIAKRLKAFADKLGIEHGQLKEHIDASVARYAAEEVANDKSADVHVLDPQGKGRTRLKDSEQAKQDHVDALAAKLVSLHEELEQEMKDGGPDPDKLAALRGAIAEIHQEADRIAAGAVGVPSNTSRPAGGLLGPAHAKPNAKRVRAKPGAAVPPIESGAAPAPAPPAKPKARSAAQVAASKKNLPFKPATLWTRLAKDGIDPVEAGHHGFDVEGLSKAEFKGGLFRKGGRKLGDVIPELVRSGDLPANADPLDLPRILGEKLKAGALAADQGGEQHIDKAWLNHQKQQEEAWQEQKAEQHEQERPAKPGEVENDDFRPWEFGGIPIGGAESRTGPPTGHALTAERMGESKRQTALANVVTDKEREKNGLPALMTPARLENEKVWDEAMRVIDANPLAETELIDELSAKPRATTIQENALLLHRRIELSNEHARAMRELLSAKLYTTDPAKLDVLNAREAAILGEISRLDDVIHKTGSEWGRAGQFRRQLAREDFSLSTMLGRAEIAKGSPLSVEEKTEITALHDKLRAAEAALAAAEAHPPLASKAGEKGDITDLRIATRTTKRVYAEKINDMRWANMPLHQKALYGTKEAFNASRSLITAFDLSGLLRQGGLLSLAHPFKAAAAIPEMLRAFASERGAERALQELKDRNNGLNMLLYNRDKLAIMDHRGPASAQEEAFIGRWVGKIPGVAASARAYTTILNRLRADVYDSLAGLSRGKQPTPAEGAAIANGVNVFSGRGSLGEKKDKILTAMSPYLFSPRLLLSRFQVLTGQPLYGGTMKTRLLLASEYARFVAGAGLIYALASLDDDAKITFDPRSTDFGKIRFGNTRLDPMAGLSQAAVFVTRIVSGEEKKANGQVVPLRDQMRYSATGKVPFGGQEVGSVVLNFARSKLAPVPGAIGDALAGKNVVGEPTTKLGAASHLMVPMSIRDVYESLADQGVPRGAAIGLLAILGMGSQTYEPGNAGKNQRGLPPSALQRGLRDATAKFGFSAPGLLGK